ncbi:unnamed protein product [Brachionus calyciflorus]|uniref:EGF-like domain-containing protein n=1 Tax=Brachionus calyciflorus TaxID=104777 RepID=A0A813W755_9BILA|nr:unnamed protein product [Brachionus calyciflorus]
MFEIILILVLLNNINCFNSVKCRINTCHNGGTCWQSLETNETKCYCEYRYFGDHCENDLVLSKYPHLMDFDKKEENYEDYEDDNSPNEESIRITSTIKSDVKHLGKSSPNKTVIRLNESLIKVLIMTRLNYMVPSLIIFLVLMVSISYFIYLFNKKNKKKNSCEYKCKQILDY